MREGPELRVVDTPATAMSTWLSFRRMRRSARVLPAVFEIGRGLGGAASREHSLGKTKRYYFLELEDPNRIALVRHIKAALNPQGILNPDTVF